MTTSVSNVAESTVRLNFSDKLAKRAVLSRLSTLQRDRLVICDGDERFEFGEVESKAVVNAVIHVHNIRAYKEVALRGTVGSGEAYMSGDWSTPNLLNVIRIFVRNLDVMEEMDNKISISSRLANWVMYLSRINSRSGSKKNISAHYDLSNTLFQLMLDNSMMYSSAVYPDGEASLEVASENKLRVLCERLELKPDDHLLEIGTGWGGMAIFAAQHYGCRVTTTTISQEQYAYAQQQIEKAGLSDRITLLLQDYRDLTGHYDKLVSVEMIEAVGHKFYSTYFRQCSNLLKPNGLMVIQAITIPDQRYHQAKNDIDFIQKYIFPGGCLPSSGIITRHLAEDTNMQLLDCEDITVHYAKTLRDWRQRFFANLESVKALGFDTRFIRMWEFYLCYCEGGFMERAIGTSHFVFAKPDYRRCINKAVCP